MARRRQGRIGLVAAAGLAALAVGLTGCSGTAAATGSGAAGAAGSKGSAAGQPAAQALSLAVTPLNGSTKVRPDQRVSVTASGGTLSAVTVTPDSGAPLLGSLSADHRTWTSDDPLHGDTHYVVAATGIDAGGKSTTSSSRFSTLSPSRTTTATVQPSDGTVVGVGMPVMVNFSRPIATKDRTAVQDRLTVTASPAVTGAWNWTSSVQVQYRPRTFWKPGTRVHVSSDLTGVETSTGVWGKKGRGSTDFTIGSSMISTVDMHKHTLTVRRNGTVLRVIPITTGKPGFVTRSGIKVIISRESTHQMDAATTGIDKNDPEYYNLLVHYAMRLTYSGEFFHAAPWSVPSQGHANVSHGCTGMSMANAAWFYNNSKIGDVAVFTGSQRSLEPGNGYTAWNEPFAQWASAD